MKTRYDRLAKSTGYNEDDGVWLGRPTCMERKSSKLQSSWEGQYRVVTRINDVVYRIQRHPRYRMIEVNVDRLAPYEGTA
jgi:hypothetical protein